MFSSSKMKCTPTFIAFIHYLGSSQQPEIIVVSLVVTTNLIIVVDCKATRTKFFCSFTYCAPELSIGHPNNPPLLSVLGDFLQFIYSFKCQHSIRDKVLSNFVKDYREIFHRSFSNPSILSRPRILGGPVDALSTHPRSGDIRPLI